MVEKTKSEFAVIFNRIKSEDNKVEQFIPVKVVEGYYYEEQECFIDSDQNVYPHMASPVDFGNVFACRSDMIEVLKANSRASLTSLKKRILKRIGEYEYFKSIDENSENYGIIQVFHKRTKKIALLEDSDTENIYQTYFESKGNNQELTDQNEPDNEGRGATPDEIIAEIKKTIKGQDEAIEKIMTLLWIRYNIPTINKTNMLVFGPSGVGKSTIFRKIKEQLNIPISIYTISGDSQTSDINFDEMLVQYYLDAGGDAEKAKRGIIVIDRFDKIANTNTEADIINTSIQSQLSKLIDGCERYIALDDSNIISIDTSNVTFICCGTFENMYGYPKQSIGFSDEPMPAKLNTCSVVDASTIANKGGIIPELADRFHAIIKLNDIKTDRAVLKDILFNSSESSFKQIIDSLTDLGIEVEGLDNIVDQLIENAIKKKIGIRELVSTSLGLFIKIFKEIGNDPDKYERVIIGPNLLNNPTDYELVQKRTKKHIKSLIMRAEKR